MPLGQALHSVTLTLREQSFWHGKYVPFWHTQSSNVLAPCLGVVSFNCFVQILHCSAPSAELKVPAEQLSQASIAVSSCDVPGVQGTHVARPAMGVTVPGLQVLHEAWAVPF